jgi:oligoendopeptidase F
MWKQFKENKEIALDNYMNALSLGGTKTLPELYRTAGLSFDFSPAYIKELAHLFSRKWRAFKIATNQSLNQKSRCIYLGLSFSAN